MSPLTHEPDRSDEHVTRYAGTSKAGEPFTVSHLASNGELGHWMHLTFDNGDSPHRKVYVQMAKGTPDQWQTVHDVLADSADDFQAVLKDFSEVDVRIATEGFEQVKNGQVVGEASGIPEVLARVRKAGEQPAEKILEQHNATTEAIRLRIEEALRTDETDEVKPEKVEVSV